MSYLLAVCDPLNNCDFGILLEDAKDAPKAKEYGIAGLRAWYDATSDPEDIEGNEYFTSEEIEGFYGLGYAEPTEMLLRKEGIKFEIVDLQYEDDDEEYGEPICDDIVVY